MASVDVHALYREVKVGKDEERSTLIVRRYIVLPSIAAKHVYNPVYWLCILWIIIIIIELIHAIYIA